jgi:hypothetical protein
MQAARRRDDFDSTSRLGRRVEAGPRQVLPRVGRQLKRGRSAAACTPDSKNLNAISRVVRPIIEVMLRARHQDSPHTDKIGVFRYWTSFGIFRDKTKHSLEFISE